jgi:hypothetical protein
MYKVVYVDGAEIKSNPCRDPAYAREYFETKKALDIPCALLEDHEGEGNGATAIAKHRYDELIIAFDKWATPKGED